MHADVLDVRIMGQIVIRMGAMGILKWALSQILEK